MKVSEMIKKLVEIQDKHGDLPIIGGYLTDEETVQDIDVLDVNGEVYDHSRGRKIDGVFISQ